MAEEPTASDPDAHTPEIIQVFRNANHIRERPAMYIGDTGSWGLRNLVFELVNNSLDEIGQGFGNRIAVELLADGGCRVSDNGRGIPVVMVVDAGKRFAELALTMLGATAKISSVGYRTMPGLHSIGLKAATALSERLVLEVQRGGNLWRQAYSRGRATGEMAVVGPAAVTGTSITFWPDPEIFQISRSFDREPVGRRLCELAFLNRGVTVELIDHRRPESGRDTFHFPNGLADYLRSLLAPSQPAHPHLFAFRHQAEDHEVEVALQWTTSSEERLLSYANCGPTLSGGTHVTGFRAGLTRLLRTALAHHTGTAVAAGGLMGDDVRKGIIAVLAIKVREPQWQGALKDRLCNPEAKGLVARAMAEHFGRFLLEYPDDARAICVRVLAAARARQEAARRRRRGVPQRDPKAGES